LSIDRTRREEEELDQKLINQSMNKNIYIAPYVVSESESEVHDDEN